MLSLLIVVFGALTLGMVAAVAWWVVRGRRDALPWGLAAGFTAIAGVIGLLAYTTTLLINAPFLIPLTLPSGVVEVYFDYRFTIPAVVGIVLLILLAIPFGRRGTQGVAELAPRGPFSFSRGWWFIAPGVTLGLNVLFTIVAGAASEPDEITGRYTMYVVELSGQHAMGTSIYGWFYSIPALIAAVIMLAVAFVDMALIASPPLATNRVEDARIRTIRSRNVIAVATGALFLQLGLILASLAGTASLEASFTTDIGRTTFWTPFAALIPALTGASYVAAGLGVALWATVALSALPARRPAPALVRA